MVRDLMTNCRHLILFLVVQKILASLKLTTVFTVTTECISQNSSEKKFQLQPGIIAHSQNQTRFFRRNWDSFFLFDMATPPRKKFLIKLTRRHADGQNVHHQRGNSDGTSGAPLRALSGRLRCLVCLWASRNRTFPVSLQPRGLCDRR